MATLLEANGDSKVWVQVSERTNSCDQDVL